MAKYTERNRQVVRQWEVLLALQETPLDAVTLASRLGTTVRTIYRDLDALQAARFALYSERHSDGVQRWHLLGRNVAPERVAA